MLVGEGVLDAADIMFPFATLTAVIASVNAISFMRVVMEKGT